LEYAEWKTSIVNIYAIGIAGPGLQVGKLKPMAHNDYYRAELSSDCSNLGAR